MASLNEEEISRRLSHTLDCLGYSSQMVQIRKNFYSIDHAMWNINKSQVWTRTVGSRGEGLVKRYESDHDVLFFTNFVLAIDDFVDIECIPDKVTVFRMVPCLLHPGHYKLLLIRQGSRDHLTVGCFNPLENDVWLSSKEYVTKFTKQSSTGADIQKTSGPARTDAWSNHHVSFDSVKTFACVCPSTIQHWIQRPRRHDWPSIDLKERISLMSGNIVATGRKGCPDEEIEWRLCFNETEVLLVDSWNDTQRKLYKILKFLNKDVINKAGFDISSYIMKNIVLWLAETYPQSRFCSENLLLWVFKSLRLLRKAVKIYYIPYYMIPGRNLIAERIPRCQQKSLMKEISALIQCGPQLLWECEKLEFAMSMTPSELLYYKEKCDRLEVLFMMHFIQKHYDKVTNTDSDIKAEIAKETTVLINSDWPPAVTELLQDIPDIADKIIVLLS